MLPILTRLVLLKHNSITPIKSPVINDTTDTTDEPLRIYRPDNDDDEKLRHINEMMKNILGEDEDSGKNDK